MPYAVFETKSAIDNLNDIIARHPNHHQDYIDIYNDAKKWIVNNGNRRSYFSRYVKIDLVVNNVQIHFTETWTVDWYPIRLEYFHSQGSGGVAGTETDLIFAVREVPPLSLRGFNPGLWKPSP